LTPGPGLAPPLPEGEGRDAEKVQVIALPCLDQEGGAFLDTAAVIQNLDLVVTCDTSIAHLAGALGAPTWVALGAAPDWRWMLDRQDTPWYPTMRLFRQHADGDWAGVFERMAQSLVTWTCGSPHPALSQRERVEMRQERGAELTCALNQSRSDALPGAAAGAGHRETFQQIYDEELWGGGSGHGSRKTSTAPYRQLLITNSAPGAAHVDLDMPGQFRPLDLRRPPFNFAAHELLRYESIPGDEKLVLLT